MIVLKIKNVYKLINSLKNKAAAGNIHFNLIFDYTQRTFDYFLKDTIQKQAEIELEQLSSYKLQLLKQNWEISHFKAGIKNFLLIHVKIMKIMPWIGGIHIKISSKYAKSYLSEFSYRMISCQNET
ncbi:MAG: hypothetical protein ACOVRK_12450 [Chryseobacterium taeanense]